MLTLFIPGIDLYDEPTNSFKKTNSCTLTLEHSLLSISKWESTYKEPFLSSKEFTKEKFKNYIMCMVIGPYEPKNFLGLTDEHLKLVQSYIDDPMTATTFSKNNNNRVSREIITAEIIYYRMFANNIPMECHKWHLNRLLTLIRVCEEKNAPSRKMSRRQTAERNAMLNAARRKQFNTRG